MENIIVDIMNNYGYLGIFFLIAIENIFPPIPSELILTFGGYMTLNTNMNILNVIIFSTVGSLFGAYILYFIGRLLNKDTLIKIISSKYGKLLRLKPKDIKLADKWFDNRGHKTVLLCRFIPIVRSLISIPAGMSEMPFVKFSFYTLLGSVIWNTILIFVGAFAGEKRNIILDYIDKFSYIILALLIVIIVVVIARFYRKKSCKKN